MLDDGSASNNTSSILTTVNVTAVNDAPIAVIAPLSYGPVNRQTGLDLKNTGLSVSDVDASVGVTATLSVTEASQHRGGRQRCAREQQRHQRGDDHGQHCADQRVARHRRDQLVTYVDNTDTPSAAPIDLQLTINDAAIPGRALSASDDALISVTAVNDAPVNHLPGPQQSQPDTDHVIAGLSISDADAASGSLATTLSVDHGTLVVTSAGGAAVTGSGTDTVLLTGTLAQINTTLGALNNVVYHSDTGFIGNDALTMHTDDGGNTGTGGALSDTDTLALNLGHVLPLLPQGDGHFDPAHVTGRLLRHDDGTFRIDNIDANQLSSHVVGAVGTEFRFLDLGDFNGDGNSDILSQRFTDNMLFRHSVANDQVVGAGFLGAIGGDWNFQAVGDFNHDGTSDLLWQQDGSGMLLIHTLQNNQVVAGTFLGAIGTDWKFLGAGDFNHDGTSDLLWQQDGSGMLLVHDIQSNHVSGAALLGQIGSDWHFAGIGDFNGDNTDDFLFQDNNGTLQVYNINNNQVTSSQQVGTLAQDTFIAGIGDYTGDGHDDLILRHDNGTTEVRQVPFGVGGAGIITGQTRPNGTSSDEVAGRRRQSEADDFS